MSKPEKSQKKTGIDPKKLGRNLTRPSALGMSDPVMESLEILGAPEFSNL